MATCMALGGSSTTDRLLKKEVTINQLTTSWTTPHTPQMSRYQTQIAVSDAAGKDFRPGRSNLLANSLKLPNQYTICRQMIHSDLKNQLLRTAPSIQVLKPSSANPTSMMSLLRSPKSSRQNIQQSNQWEALRA